MTHYALVTGASSGMGLIYAEALAARGYQLLMVSNQEKELTMAAERLAARYQIRAIAHYQDLATSEAADELYRYCQEENLDIEVLVNNAGMFFFKELSSEDIGRGQALMNLHIVTVTRMCLLFGEDMKRRGSGYILIVSSLAAMLPVPGITLYAASKAYLKSFGKSLYFEMRPYGVGVTTVCPAAVATPLYGLKPKLMKLGVKVGAIKTPQWLVKRALRGMFRHRPVVRPGLQNYYLPPLIIGMPRRLESWIWGRLKGKLK